MLTLPLKFKTVGAMGYQRTTMAKAPLIHIKLYNYMVPDNTYTVIKYTYKLNQ